MRMTQIRAVAVIWFIEALRFMFHITHNSSKVTLLVLCTRTKVLCWTMKANICWEQVSVHEHSVILLFIDAWRAKCFHLYFSRYAYILWKWKKEPRPFVWFNIQFARLHAGWVFCRMPLTSSLRKTFAAVW